MKCVVKDERKSREREKVCEMKPYVELDGWNGVDFMFLCFLLRSRLLLVLTACIELLLYLPKISWPKNLGFGCFDLLACSFDGDVDACVC